MDNLRKLIDKIDKEIISLLALRMECSDDIGGQKKSSGQKVYDHEREKQIFYKVTSEAQKKGLSCDFVNEIFLRIFEESRRRQEMSS